MYKIEFKDSEMELIREFHKVTKTKFWDDPKEVRRYEDLKNDVAWLMVEKVMELPF